MAPKVVADERGGVGESRFLLAAYWAWAASLSYIIRSMGPADACELEGLSIVGKVKFRKGFSLELNVIIVILLKRVRKALIFYLSIVLIGTLTVTF